MGVPAKLNTSVPHSSADSADFTDILPVIWSFVPGTAKVIKVCEFLDSGERALPRQLHSFAHPPDLQRT